MAKYYRGYVHELYILDKFLICLHSRYMEGRVILSSIIRTPLYDSRGPDYPQGYTRTSPDHFYAYPLTCLPIFTHFSNTPFPRLPTLYLLHQRLPIHLHPIVYITLRILLTPHFYMEPNNPCIVLFYFINFLALLQFRLFLVAGPLDEMSDGICSPPVTFIPFHLGTDNIFFCWLLSVSFFFSS